MNQALLDIWASGLSIGILAFARSILVCIVRLTWKGRTPVDRNACASGTCYTGMDKRSENGREKDKNLEGIHGELTNVLCTIESGVKNTRN